MVYICTSNFISLDSRSGLGRYRMWTSENLDTRVISPEFPGLIKLFLMPPTQVSITTSGTLQSLEIKAALGSFREPQSSRITPTALYSLRVLSGVPITRLPFLKSDGLRISGSVHPRAHPRNAANPN
jgi:hypothetical protein